MIRFRIKELMEERGMKKPKYKHFTQRGISHDIVKGYMTGKKTEMDRGHLEIFCIVLRCTPNELFEWVPDANSAPIDELHPLHTIKPRPKFNLQNAIEKMTPDEIRALFDKQKQETTNTEDNKEDKPEIKEEPKPEEKKGKKK